MSDVQEATRHRFVLIGGEGRLDVSAPVDQPLGEALRSVGVTVDPGAHALVTEAGVDIDPTTLIADLPDGALVNLIGFDPAVSPTGASDTATDGTRRDQAAPWLLLATIAAVIIAGATVSLATDTALHSGTAQSFAALVLALGALATGAAWALPKHAPLPAAALGVPLSLAFAAAVLGLPPVHRGAHLGMTAGLLAAALLAAGTAAVARDHRSRATSSAIVIALLAVAGVWGVTLLVDAPASAAAAISMGIVAPGLRLVPALLLRLPEGYAIEYRHFLGNRWSVRGAIPADPGAVSMDTVRSYVGGAQARLDAGVVTLSGLAAVTAPFVGPLVLHDELVPRIGAIILVITTVLALVLWPRRAARPSLRWTPRLSAAAVVVTVLAQVAQDAQQPGRLIVVMTAMAVGIVAAMLIAPVSARRTALGWSRLGDIVESASVTLALPAGLLAAGTLEFVRAMVSG